MEMVYEKVKLFRKQMEILIPEGFKDMPDYVAKKKYPSKHRPPVILMDKNNMVNFTFHLMDMALAEGQLKKAAEGFVKSMKQVYVNAKFQELQYGERNDGGKIAWLAYETMAIDADIFNIMFITPLEGNCCMVHLTVFWECRMSGKKSQCTVLGRLRR